MKILADPDHLLAGGLAAIRQQFALPAAFPPAVLAAAEAAASRRFTDHADRTAMLFVTLDPASSTDLDQAFAIARSGNDLLLHYAIADVAWFVDDDDPVDREAWRRGATQYFPDSKVSLYPPALSEAAASLLPDGPRAAIMFTVRIDPEGKATLDGAERAIIRSRAKLAYATVQPGDLPDGFAELADRIAAAEARRGAARVDPPEQEVRAVPGGFTLAFRPRLAAEDHNAALSLATNLAVAAALLAHQTGLFRVMAEPDARDLARLRHTARAFGLDWPADHMLARFESGLNAARPADAAMMLAIRRAGGGARYDRWHDGVRPWHAAVAAPYAHATAPLRRLADRYVIRAVLAIANSQPVPDAVTAAFERLPKVMARADQLGNRIDRAVIDLAEVVMMKDRIGEVFAAIVTDIDDRGARIQFTDLPIVDQVPAHRAHPGDAITVRLTATDPAERSLTFERVG